MKLIIKIDSSNDALSDLDEVVRIVRSAAKKVDATCGAPDSGKLQDINGNTVGSWEFSGLDET